MVTKKACIPAMLLTGFLLMCVIGTLGAGGIAEKKFVPDGTVEIVVPADSGGASDLLAHIIASLLGQSLHPVEFKVVFKPGGSGTAALAYVNGRKDADQTLLVANTSQILAILEERKNLPLTPIARLATDPILLVVPADSGYSDLAMFVNSARAEELLVGTADAFDRYCVARMNSEIGLTLRTIYFNSALPVINGMLEGSLDAGILNPSEAMEGVAAGKLRILAAFSETDLPVLSFAGLGYGELAFQLSRYLFGPQGMHDEARLFWSEALSIMTQRREWESGYLEQNHLHGEYLDSTMARSYLETEELPRLHSILDMDAP